MHRCIIYLSAASKEFTENEIDNMANEFQKANQLHSVTGFLVYDNARFFQYIEGQANEIEPLMQNIRKDDRHEVLTEATKMIEQRRFNQWSMTVLEFSDLTKIMAESKALDFMTFSHAHPGIIPNWEAQAWEIIDTIASKQSKLA